MFSQLISQKRLADTGSCSERLNFPNIGQGKVEGDFVVSETLVAELVTNGEIVVFGIFCMKLSMFTLNPCLSHISVRTNVTGFKTSASK